MPASVLIIWKYSIEAQDGCSAQIKRLFENTKLIIIQIGSTKLTASHKAPFDFHYQHVQTYPPIELLFGGRTLRKIWKFTILKKQIQNIKKKFSKSGITPNIAYIVAADNSQAELALAVLKEFDIKKYILHVMDIYEDNLRTLEETSALKTLVHKADKILSTTDSIGCVLNPYKSTTFPLVSSFATSPQKNHNTTIRFIMGGAIYESDNRCSHFLSTVILPAWLKTKTEYNMEWVYYGNNFNRLPPDLKPHVKDLGVLTDPELEKTLKRSTVAILPILHGVDSKFRHSFPSRIYDFLAAGLPIITMPPNGSAFGVYIKKHANKSIVPLGNEKEAANFFSSLCTNEILLTHFRERATQEAARHTPKKVRESFSALLEQLKNPKTKET